MTDVELQDLKQAAKIAALLHRERAEREYLIGNIGSYMRLVAIAERLETAIAR